jgi:hypothetical protein
MPLARYFYFVGGALLALLFFLDAYFPKPPVAAKAKVYLPAIHIYSDRKWPERIVYDTSLPTIVPTSVATRDAIIKAPEIIAKSSVGATERESFAMLSPSGEQLQTSSTKIRELKPRHQVRIVRKRTSTSRLAIARHPQFVQFGWYGRTFW